MVATRCQPVHVFVKPEQELPSPFESMVVGRSVGGLVLGRKVSMPLFYLTGESHHLCNKAYWGSINNEHLPE